METDSHRRFLAAGPSMRFNLPDRRFLLACATLGLAICALAFPTTARAECGDYVTVNRGPGQSTANSAHTAVMPDAPIPGPRPACHGPGCSVPPPQPIRFPPSKPIDRPGLDLASADSENGQDSQHEWVIASDMAVTTTFPSAIFHPPRDI